MDKKGQGDYIEEDEPAPPPNSLDISHRSVLLLVEWKGSTATEVRNLVVTKDMESRKDE